MLNRLKTRRVSEQTSEGFYAIDPLAGTYLDGPPQHGTNVPKVQYVDVSLGTPQEQFDALARILEAGDIANPAPYTGTPPWGEPTDEQEYVPDFVLDSKYMPAADLEAASTVDTLDLLADAYPLDMPRREWYMDPQYFGLGVPPGVPNFDQDIESGHTQHVQQNPSAEMGSTAWSGRPAIARVARMFNDYPLYGKDVDRHFGERVPIKLDVPFWTKTQQGRDLLLAELKRRGVHEVVVSQQPSITYTEEATWIDPSTQPMEEAIGPAGVLPFDSEQHHMHYYPTVLASETPIGPAGVLFDARDFFGTHLAAGGGV